jgi:hypothetical protein
MTTPRSALAIAEDALRLRRFEQDRAAVCKALGIVDDESADLPAMVHALKVRDERRAALLKRIDQTLRNHVCVIDFVPECRDIAMEFGR